MQAQTAESTRGTYWNTWAFELTPRRREVRGLGPLPQGSGEFFTSAWWTDKLAIPNYQGKLYLVDCSSEFTNDTNRSNPQILACVPRAHYGLACATTADNRLVYSTYPNYDQIGGMLVMCVQDQPPLVWDSIADGLTLGSLATIDGVVFGGTMRAHGLGLKLTPSRQRMPQIVALSVTQKKILDILTLESKPGDVKGLITLSDKQLLCATEKRLFLVNMDSSKLHAVEISNFHRFKQIYGCRIRQIARYCPRYFLILTDQFLFVFVQDTQKVVPLCRLPRQVEHLVADDDGNVLFCLERQHLLFSSQLNERTV